MTSDVEERAGGRGDAEELSDDDDRLAKLIAEEKRRRDAKKRKAAKLPTTSAEGYETDEAEFSSPAKDPRKGVGVEPVKSPASVAREAEAYRFLVSSEKTPIPTPRFWLVLHSDESGLEQLEQVKAHLAMHGQDFLGLKLGSERPIFIICKPLFYQKYLYKNLAFLALVQAKRPVGFTPHIAVLSTGEHSADALRRFGYVEDLFASNKPRKAKPDTPLIGRLDCGVACSHHSYLLTRSEQGDAHPRRPGAPATTGPGAAQAGERACDHGHLPAEVYYPRLQGGPGRRCAPGAVK